MNTTYSNTPIHLFIKEYIESENGEVKDVCEEYFTIRTPALLEPIKYTYKPAIAHKKKIDLIATGSPAYNSIIEERISIEMFDKYNSLANEFLDQIIKDKRNIFDLQLKKEVGNKLTALEKKLDDEKLQKSISKKLEFNEKEWKLKKDSILDKEKESLETFVSVKFLNFLLINTARVLFEVKLNNNAVIKNSLLIGIENNLKIICPLCENEIFEGYGTHD